MTLKARNLGLLSAVIAMAGVTVWFFLVRIPPVTAEFLQGEWIQDPEFLQHAGQDLEAQKREIDLWENYEFLFKGQHLSGWRLTFDDGAKNMSGWAEGRGIAFESEFTLAPAKKATLLRFTDHTKAPAEAHLSREGEKVALVLGDRRLRLMKSPTTRVGK